MKNGQQVAWCKTDGTVQRVKITELLMTEGLDRVTADSAGPGDLVAVAGIEDIMIGDTLADPNDPRPLPPLTVDEPSISITIGINTSPLSGKSGKKLTARLIKNRLEHPTPPECWRAQFVATGPFLSAGAPVEKIDVPVLVVHGDADRVVPLSNGRLLARRIRGAELVVVPGVGHVVPLESPDEFNRLVENFLARHDQ